MSATALLDRYTFGDREHVALRQPDCLAHFTPEQLAEIRQRCERYEAFQRAVARISRWWPSFVPLFKAQIGAIARVARHSKGSNAARRTTMTFQDTLARNMQRANDLRRRGIPVTVETLRAAEAAEQEDSAPPNPYADGLAKLRAASSTPERSFEEEWKAARLRALEREHADIDAQGEASPIPRLTAAELADYRAPDPYKAGLDNLRREKR